MHLPYLHWSVITLWLPGLYYVDTLDPRRCALLSGTKMLAGDPILSCKLPGGGVSRGGLVCPAHYQNSRIGRRLGTRPLPPETPGMSWLGSRRCITQCCERPSGTRARTQIHAQTCMRPYANTPESAYIFPFVRMQVLRSPAPTPGAQGHLNSHIPGITSHPAGA